MARKQIDGEVFIERPPLTWEQYVALIRNDETPREIVAQLVRICHEIFTSSEPLPGGGTAYRRDPILHARFLMELGDNVTAPHDDSGDDIRSAARITLARHVVTKFVHTSPAHSKAWPEIIACANEIVTFYACDLEHSADLNPRDLESVRAFFTWYWANVEETLPERLPAEFYAAVVLTRSFELRPVVGRDNERIFLAQCIPYLYALTRHCAKWRAAYRAEHDGYPAVSPSCGIAHEKFLAWTREIAMPSPDQPSTDDEYDHFVGPATRPCGTLLCRRGQWGNRKFAQECARTLLEFVHAYHAERAPNARALTFMDEDDTAPTKR